MTTLKKFRSQPYITANRIKEISNRLTAEHGLSVSLKREEQLDKNGFVHEKDVHQSFRAELRRRLRFVASRATSPEMFDQLCEQLEITTTKRGQDRGIGCLTSSAIFATKSYLILVPTRPKASKKPLLRMLTTSDD